MFPRLKSGSALLRAPEGGWDEEAKSAEDLRFSAAEPGAYGAEVRIVPKHLQPHVGKRMDLTRKERVWIYSNAIYVR
jgi:hypothetical protein